MSIKDKLEHFKQQDASRAAAAVDAQLSATAAIRVNMNKLHAHIQAQSDDLAKLGIKISFSDEDFFARYARHLPDGGSLPGGMISLSYRFVSISFTGDANGYHARATVPEKIPHLQGAAGGFLADLDQVDQFIARVINDVDVGKIKRGDPVDRGLRRY